MAYIGRNPNGWTIRKLVQNTYEYDKKRFDFKGLSKGVSYISINHETVHPDPNNLEKTEDMFVIRTHLTEGNHIMETGQNGKKYDTGRKYGEVEIRIATLSIDDDTVKLIDGRGREFDFTKSGNEWVDIRTSKYLTSSEAKKSVAKVPTFLLDRPLLSALQYLIDAGVIQ